MTEGHAHTNRLAQETSPYLLQHQHNPVDWYPWGEEALRRARDEHKPILLSVGYSSCHWCHVMERESFEDEATAEVMNAKFVCIKVDREERPDIDEIYMQATLALSGGRGGWPMNVFLTPELEPFYAGTYFPPVDRFGMPSWVTILNSIAALWADDEQKVLEQAGELTQVLRNETAQTHGGAVDPVVVERAVDELGKDFDPKYGGFGKAPKFPRAEAITLLLRHHKRRGVTRSLAMAGKTLECMARGGIYDQIGGGFARYSVDDRWLVPHFEKMLYDNAALTRAYLAGYQATGEALFKAVAAETLEYVLREMTSPEGGFYSATDADSEGVEGKFFVWTPEEVAAVVGPEVARQVCAWFDVTEAGNFEGKSILNTPRSAAAVAAALGISSQELETTIADAAPKLYAARQERIAPGLDDKILTAWNGLMIGALAEGSRVLDEPRYLAAATRAADFLLTTMIRDDGGLRRSFRVGEARFDAYLEDYAYLCDALIDLYEAGGQRRYLAAATVLAERLLSDFAPEEGGAFFNTAQGHEQLLIRYREGHDGACPNPNAVAAMALARLSYHLDMPEMRQAARMAIEAYGKKIQQLPRAFCASLAVIDFLHTGPVELALVGTPGAPDFEAFRKEIGRRFVPNRVLAFDGGPTADDAELPRLPLLDGKEPVDGKAALYVCKNYACQAPITNPNLVATALG